MKKKQPAPVKIAVIPQRPEVRKPVIRVIKTYHPRYGIVERKVIE